MNVSDLRINLPGYLKVSTNLLVSTVEDAQSVEASDRTPEEVITAIRTGRWRQPVERIRREFQRVMRESNGDRKKAKLAVGSDKQRLPAILWSGSFSKREKHGLRRHSGLIAADLDELGDKLSEIRTKLKSSAYLYALFVSPTGDGVKAIFRVPADQKMHPRSWEAVRRHVIDLTGVQIDEACKDIARLCFLSFDPEAYFNPIAQELLPAPEAEKPTIRKSETQPAIEARRQIAVELLGPIEWTSDTEGFATCPGKHLHTTGDGQRDCEVHLDGVPTIHCFHNHCLPIQGARNRELRSRIGKRGQTEDNLDSSALRKRSNTRLQGAEVEFAGIELWPEPVNGAAVLTEVAATIRRYVALPETAADAIALWCAHTHVFQEFQCSPRLNISSPEKGCGKTTLRDVVSLLVPRPILTENLSVAVLFRLVDAHAPVILADEYDGWLRDNEELRSLLNAGHRRGAQVYRCEGDHNQVRGFRASCPAVLCGIGSLPSTLHDRSIVVRLERAKIGELQSRFDSRRTGPEKQLCQQLARWCSDNRQGIAANDPVLPHGLCNRRADNWRPLFAVAEIAGGDWPQRCRAAFVKLTGREDTETQSIGVMLLADIAEVFRTRGADRIFSKELVEDLCDMRDRPWPESQRGKPLTERSLARYLAPFDIHPKTLRIDANRAKGYERADFNEKLDRYLPEQSVRDNVPSEEKIASPTVTSTSAVTDGGTGATLGMSRCHGQNSPGDDAGNSFFITPFELFNGKMAE
jgi:Protein of unknown function (DUF3631)/VirE N-terminal domain